MTVVAGMAAFGRSAAAVVRTDGPAEVAVEEWFSRRRLDPGLPERAFAWCLNRAGASAETLTHLAFAEKPVQKFVRLLGGLAAGFPGTLRLFPEAMTTWLGDRLWLSSTLVKRLGVRPEQVLFVERNLAFAASAWFSSGFSDAAVVVADGTGEWSTTAVYRARQAAGSPPEFTAHAEIPHPHSLTQFLDAIRHHLLLPETGGLRWLAALAALGEPRFTDALRALLPAEPDGAFSLARQAFDFTAHGPRLARAAWQGRFAPRAPHEPLVPAAGAGVEARRFADLASSAVAVCTERCLALLEFARKETGAERLCVGGRVFALPGLVAQVVAKAPFAAVHVDPLCDESAAALGAALYVSRVALGLSVQLPAPGEGPVEAPAATAGLTLRAVTDAERAARGAAVLAGGGTLGWIQGPPEVSDRPDGVRVLLADPAHAAACGSLRERIKMSEAFVPLGLVGLAEAEPVFGPAGTLTAAQRAGVAPIRVPETARARLTAGVHADGTALYRQVVPETHPRLCALLREFARTTGRAPLLAVSSCNRAGEPVLLTVAETLQFVRRSELTAMLLGDWEITHAGQ